MNLKLSLLVVTALVVVAEGEVTGSGDKLRTMRENFMRWRSSHPHLPVNYAASSAYSAASAASAVAASSGDGYYSDGPYPYYSHGKQHATGNMPSPRYAVSGRDATGGYGARSAGSEYAGYGHGHPRVPHRHGARGPTHAGYQPRPEPARYTPVHPPAPRVAEKFFRGRNDDSGVSTSVAAAGSVAAAAAAAAQSGSSGVSGVSYGAHRPSSSTAGAAAGSFTSGRGHAGSSHSLPVDEREHAVETESSSEHYSQPETLDQFGAVTGTFGDDDRGVVTSSYVRSTENEEEHEDGKEDSDHYYRAGSYGKTHDEAYREKYGHDDEDLVHTPTVFRKKKSKVEYTLDKNKARRESGSNVLAQDKYSASYNKDKKKFNEDVKHNFHAEGKGVLETGSSHEKSNADEESEERFDSRNLGDFVGVDGVRHDKRPVFNPAAAAAASASSAGTSSSAAAGSH